MRVTQESLPDLRKEIPYKWKVQTAKHWGCECVAYIDARQVMDLLDEVVGPQNWQDHYREVAGKVYCDLSIQVEDEWITKSDCGTASHFEAEKGQASDAFKRAAVKWGIGRFLYQLSTVRTKSIETGKDDRGNPRFFPADEQGQRIYNLTGYIHNLQSRKKTGYEPASRKTPSAASSVATEKPNNATRPLRQGLGSSLSGVEGSTSPADEAATQPQRDEIRLLCETLGWSGTEFSKYLQAKKLSWKHLMRSQAARLINELESQLPSGIHALSKV
ncbi:MAG: Rad52/Rad22 family DNA repair protein [Candidatus Sericytochromatia bacterium]